MANAQKGTLNEVLFPNLGSFNDPAVRALLFDQYKLYVDSFEKVVARRQTVHSLFLSVNLFLATGVGLAARDLATSPWVVAVIIVIAAFVGLVISGTWRCTLRSYTQLSTGKRAIISEIERHLPAALYTAEWHALGRGEDPKKYRPLMQVERRLPTIFFVAYALAAAGAVMYLFVAPGK